MQTYKVTLTGKTPLLMHFDNIEWADFMAEWQSNPDNKAQSKAGDDRTPAWRWLGCVYHDNQHVVMPQDCIMRCLMNGGAMVPVPGGKSGKTFKSQTQSGMMCVEPSWNLQVDGKPIKWNELKSLQAEKSFSKHREAVKQLGFDLLVKRAKVGASKHIRVRPQFSAGWALSGTLAVWDEQLTLEALRRIIDFSGQYKGLGDWRPGGRTPGPYGTFEGTIS